MPDPKMTTKFHQWLAIAPFEVKQELAECAGLGYTYVAYSLARPYQNPPSIRVAIRIEEAIAKVNAKHPELELPTVQRDDIAEICYTCPYAIAARRGN